MGLLDSIYEKQGNILLIQVDHIPGEIIGTVIDDFFKAGVYNVQVISSITKKNRPGYLMLIDTSSEENPEVERIIVEELGVTGWHMLRTGHRHVATEIKEHMVVFETPNGSVQSNVKVKIIKESPERVRPEHSCCLKIRQLLNEHGVYLSLNDIQSEIVRQLKQQEK